jgi:hypothetical protein
MDMNKIDELLKIKELLDSGIISEKEFKELKNNLIQLDNNGKSTSEIIPNNIKKCSNCNSIINDNETICENCNVIDSKITSSDSLSENIIPISNSKIKYFFLGIIILCLVIGLNGYYNNSNKSPIESNEIPPDTTAIVAPYEKGTNEISNPDTLTTDEKLMMPAVQKTESPEEVDEGGDYISTNSENNDSNGSINIQTNTSINNSSIDRKDIQSSYFYGLWLFGDSNIKFMENGNCIIKDLNCRYIWSYNKGILKMTSPNGCSPTLENRIITFYEDNFTYKELQENIFRKAIKIQ